MSKAGKKIVSAPEEVADRTDLDGAIRCLIVGIHELIKASGASASEVDVKSFGKRSRKIFSKRRHR